MELFKKQENNHSKVHEKVLSDNKNIKQLVCNSLLNQ